MRAVFYDGNIRWVANTQKDKFLYGTPVNPPGTEPKYTRGTDVYVHRTKSGKIYFYFYDWSLWPGEEFRIRQASPEEVAEFLKKWLPSQWGPDEEVLNRFKELTGIDLRRA